MTETPVTSSEVLQHAGLRPTRQRLLLTSLLFGQGDRHVSAEMLFDEATRIGAPISLATVYNTLNGLTAAGALRAVAIDGKTTLFDTCTSDHWHFYNEWDGTLSDIDSADAEVQNLPTPPDGLKISSIDVLVRLSATVKDRSGKFS